MTRLQARLIKCITYLCIGAYLLAILHGCFQVVAAIKEFTGYSQQAQSEMLLLNRTRELLYHMDGEIRRSLQDGADRERLERRARDRDELGALIAQLESCKQPDAHRRVARLSALQSQLDRTWAYLEKGQLTEAREWYMAWNQESFELAQQDISQLYEEGSRSSRQRIDAVAQTTIRLGILCILFVAVSVVISLMIAYIRRQ